MATRDLPPAQWSPERTAAADRTWAEYGSHHDLSAAVGQIAGIDPESGRVWIGESALDVIRQRDAEGIESPLFLARVGFDHFLRKGGR